MKHQEESINNGALVLDILIVAISYILGFLYFNSKGYPIPWLKWLGFYIPMSIVLGYFFSLQVIVYRNFHPNDHKYAH